MGTVVTESGWNMSDKDIQAIDEARQVAERLFYHLRYDSRPSATLIDSFRGMFRVIRPVLTTKTNSARYEERVKKVELELDRLTREATREVDFARNMYNREFRLVGAPESFLNDARKLFDDLYKLKDEIGLGLLKRERLDMSGAFKRAAK